MKYCSDQELAELKAEIQDQLEENDEETLEDCLLGSVSGSVRRKGLWLIQTWKLLEEHPVTIDMANQIKKQLDNIRNPARTSSERRLIKMTQLEFNELKAQVEVEMFKHWRDDTMAAIDACNDVDELLDMRSQNKALEQSVQDPDTERVAHEAALKAEQKARRLLREIF